MSGRAAVYYSCFRFEDLKIDLLINLSIVFTTPMTIKLNYNDIYKNKTYSKIVKSLDKPLHCRLYRDVTAEPNHQYRKNTALEPKYFVIS